MDGKCSFFPDASTITANHTGADHPGFRETVTAGALSLQTQWDDFAIQIGNRKLMLGQIILFHPSVRLEDAETVLGKISAGQAAGTTMKFVPTDGSLFRAFMPEKWQGPEPPSETTRWDLPGFFEP
ncbi:hypothetical protein NG819_15445 [Pseudarthrobacter sp. Fe7]|nr:hypothetical protein NG819_15445 [Pseudarthrobacter sp. Fe7]